MKTTREIQQEKIKEELELLQRIEKQEEERKNGIVRRGSFDAVQSKSMKAMT